MHKLIGVPRTFGRDCIYVPLTGKLLLLKKIANLQNTLSTGQ